MDLKITKDVITTNLSFTNGLLLDENLETLVE